MVPSGPMSPAPGLVQRRAFAKINLDLRVLGLREDGYHELATVFQSVSLHDRVLIETLEPHAPFVVACDDPAIPVDERNLVWRAAAALWVALGRQGPPRGARVTLEKGIPAQAGLGGGSADAAIALVRLFAIWAGAAGGQPPRGLASIAAGVGADVAYFLVGGTAFGRGRGDQVEAWPDGPPLDLVIAIPPFGVSTAEAYGWFDRLPLPASSEPATRPSGNWRNWLPACRNDLERAVLTMYPGLGEIKTLLLDSGAVTALLSGSGSAVFGLFEPGRVAEDLRARLEDTGARVVATRTVSRDAYVKDAFGEDGAALGLPVA